MESRGEVYLFRILRYRILEMPIVKSPIHALYVAHSRPLLVERNMGFLVHVLHHGLIRERSYSCNLHALSALSTDLLGHHRSIWGGD